MDRVAAARVLGIDPGASPERVERAFRALVRRTHPDRFPPGSEAWEDASYAMAELNEARAVMGSPAPEPVTEVDADGTRWRWAETSTPAQPEFRVDPLAADRRARGWGLSWGAFLLVASAVSLLVGAHGTTNDALPLWAPALAITGVVSLAIGLRAHERLLARGRR
ncbi:MAG: J domain-containing protein [Candidatus Nanopelagicales bacterium]